MPRSKPFGPSALHRLVQAVFFLAMLAAGIQFAFFAAWAMGASERFVPRPASAEGFLPISALIALKRLVLTGQWDPVHPAGLAILLCALAAAVFFRKGFCGYVCRVQDNIGRPDQLEYCRKNSERGATRIDYARFISGGEKYVLRRKKAV